MGIVTLGFGLTISLFFYVSVAIVRFFYSQLPCILIYMCLWF